jgi:Ca2+-binding RTX toxin-like protein
MSLTTGTLLNGKLSFSVSDLSYLLRMVQVGDIRNSDGTNNASNESYFVTDPLNGSEFSSFIRLSGLTSYDDGINSPNRLGSNGVALPNERLISNTVSATTPADLNIPQVGGWNNLLMSVGQYIDHGLDFTSKGGNGTYGIADIPGDGAVGQMNSTRATPAPGTGTSVANPTSANPTSYNNTTTPWVDQNQTYGSDAVITNLLRATLRDANGNVVRDANGNLVKTQYLLAGAVGPDGLRGLPTYYDILINNGVDKVALDAILNDSAVQTAHAHYTQAFADFATLGSAAFVIVTQADKDAMTNANAEIAALPGYVTNGVVPNANGQILLGDASAQASGFPGVPGDVISLTQHYIAGDLRANENVALTAFHEVFHHQHNLIADQIAGVINAANSDGDSSNDFVNVTTEDIFQMSRIVMGAQYQRMVYDQFMVAMTGGIATGVVQTPEVVVNEHGFFGWFPEVDASISQEFAAAAFRVGHTQIYDSLGALDANRLTGIVDPMVVATSDAVANVQQASGIIETSLVDLFLNPSGVALLGGGANILAGNARLPAQQVDTFLTDAVRNLLVGRPQDLGALNIARGREMGTVSLNEFRRAVTQFFLATGVASSLGDAASDISAGILDPGAADPTFNLILETLRPYTSWADFGHNLRDWQPSVDANGNALAFNLADAATWGTSELRDSFMALYGAPAGATPTVNSDGTVTPSSTPYGAGTDRANLDNAWGLDNVDLWIGGLAEQSVFTATAEGILPSLMGSTFTFILQEQFDRLQDADRHYYKLDIAGTDLLEQLGAKTFTDMLRSSLGAGAQYIHSNTFQTFTLNDLAADVVNFTGDTDTNLTTDLIIANANDNILNGGLGSDDIRGGDGNDTLDGGVGEDHLYGQAGNDTLRGGVDNTVDFLFGGDGNDLLDASDPDLEAGDSMSGENGNDTLLGSVHGDIMDGGMGNDLMNGGDGSDVIKGDSGEEDSVNQYGADTLNGDAGSDKIIGGGNGDTLSGGADGDAIHGDWAATGNAEIFARAIRDINGVITGTIVPLIWDIGIVVVMDEINPITGVAFTATELAEFKAFVEGLRVNPDGKPNARGSQPLFKVVPYAGPAGNDIIAGDGGTDTIFGDGGNDTITPGSEADTVFGGRGFDTLDYGQQAAIDQIIEISATQVGSSGDLNPQVDGLVIATGDTDTFFGMESVIAGVGTGDRIRRNEDAGPVDSTISLTTGGGGIFDGLNFSGVELADGGLGTDTVNGTDGNNSFTVTTPNNLTAAGITFTGIEAVNGGLGTDTVIGTGEIDSFTVTTPNSLITGGINYSQIEQIDGGADIDTATFQGTLAEFSIEGRVVNPTGGLLSQASDLNGDGFIAVTRLANPSDVMGLKNVENFGFNDGVIDITAFANTPTNILWTGVTPSNTALPVAGTAIATLSSNADTTSGFVYALEGGSSTNFTVSAAGVVTRTGATMGANQTYTLNISSTDTTGVKRVETFVIKTGTIGANALTADASDNVIYGLAGNDTINGLSGDDSLFGQSGGDTLNGGAGNDLLVGGIGNDTLDGGTGNDTVLHTIGDGGGSVNGGADVDMLVISGTDVNNTLNAVSVGGVLTRFDGGSVSNVESITANLLAGIDTLSYSANTIANGVAVDLGLGMATGFTSISNIENVTGTGAADTLIGDSGANVLVGAGGADILTGGLGNDIFRYTAIGNLTNVAGTSDRITDYTVGDMIDLTGIDANVGAGGNQAFTFIGTGVFTGVGQARYSTNGTDTFIELNTNNTFGAEGVLTLTGVQSLSAGNFVL